MEGGKLPLHAGINLCRREHPMKNTTLLIICIWALFCRCTYYPDARLARVNQLADNHDTTAMMLLDSIDRAELTDADQHYYDLLYLKSRIKNEIFITDTLIESVTAQQ
jgi:hypothetical protein